jgi:methyl-accepting chemotaxis protein
MGSQIFDGLPSFLDLGTWTTDVIKPLFIGLQDDSVAPALALLLFCAALALCALFLLDSIHIRTQVRRRIQAVSRIKDKARFATAMPQIETLMLRSRYLRHSWQKFRETLIEPRSDDRDQVILSTERPQNYFNMAEAGLRFPLYRAMPNLLVGIGLLLTFFGLVSALYFTNEAISHTDTLKASQAALRDLLHAASFKFYTSIAGLGGSIILTMVLRYGTSKVESSFDALAFALERKLVAVTPESIAFNHYREAQEQTRNLKLFNTEVAISMGKRIEEALAATLPSYLAQAMAPIGKSLDDVAIKLTSMNEGAIGQLAGNFVDKLQGATGEQMNGLATTLGELRSSLESMNRRMNESGSGLVENVARSIEDMRGAIAAMTSALSEMTARAERGVQDGGSAMKNQIETAALALENVSRKISDVLSEATSRMTSGSEQASANFAAELTTATKAFQSASERSASRIEEAISAITRELLRETTGLSERVAQAAIGAGEESRTKMVSAGADVAQMLASIGEQLTGAVNRMQEGFNGTVREMANIERGISQHVGTIAQLSKATQETESAMIGTARSMREAGTPLAESSRLIAEASRRISDATSSAEQSIAAAQAEIRNITQLLHTTLESTAQQWQDYEKRFKGVDENLGVVLDRIIQSVQENLEALRGFVEKIDEKLSGAVDKLGGGIDELGEFAQQMEHVTAKLNGGNSNHSMSVS